MPGRSAARRFLIAALLLVSVACAQETQFQITRFVPVEGVDLRDAQDLAVGGDGILYIADTGRHRVLAFDSSGRLLAETGGRGSAHGQFQWPRQVDVSSGNNVWVLDYGNRRIEKFSRTLEYQGTLVLADEDGGERQPQAFAATPQGDLFVFDRDAGQIVRYDPLFQPRAELGQGRGGEFVSDVAEIVFAGKLGLVWWGRGEDRLNRSDVLLSPMTALRLDTVPSDLHLTAWNDCVLISTGNAILRRCVEPAVADTLLSPARLTEWKIGRIDALTVSANDEIFLLDGSAGTIHRLQLNPR